MTVNMNSTGISDLAQIISEQGMAGLGSAFQVLLSVASVVAALISPWALYILVLSAVTELAWRLGVDSIFPRRQKIRTIIS